MRIILGKIGQVSFCGIANIKNSCLMPDFVNKKSGAYLHRFQWFGRRFNWGVG